MRTLPAILLAAFTALVILASAILTTQFGTHDWPTPPTPDTASRLVTPTEGAARATRDAARPPRSARAVEHASVDRTPARTTGGDRAAAQPRVPAERRSTVPSEATLQAPQQDPQPDDSPAEAPADGPAAESGVGTDPAPSPAPAPTPVGGGDPPVIDAGTGDDAQARPQDEPAPHTPAPAAPDDEAPEDPRGPIRHLLQGVLDTP